MEPVGGEVHLGRVVEELARAARRAAPDGRPPALTTIVCAAASSRLVRRAYLRSSAPMGCDRAEVGAGADDDLGAGLAQASDGVGEQPRRALRPHRVRDVVRADHDDGDVRAYGEDAIDLCGEVGAARPHDRDVGEQHGSAGRGGEVAGQRPARSGRRVVGAEPGGARVAEDREAQGGAARYVGARREVAAVGVRRHRGARADLPARLPGLQDQHADARPGERRAHAEEAAAALRGDDRDLPHPLVADRQGGDATDHAPMITHPCDRWDRVSGHG